MISLSHIHKTFNDKTVIEDFSFTFEEGKKYQIEGDSGIGKTTLLRIMMGLEKPTSGEITCKNGKPSFAPVFQESQLIDDQNSILNIQIANRKLTKNNIQKALEEILPADCLLKPVKELSGGMRRRVEIARCVLSDHAVLIMDEPFASLDKENIDSVVEFIEKRRRGRTLIFTSHIAVELSNTIKVTLQ